MISLGSDAALKRYSVSPRHWQQVMLTFLVCIVLLPHMALKAQNATGRVLGNVTDTQGAAIPGAKVTVTNVGTGVSWDAVTDSRGAYRVDDLPIGNYSVTVTFRS